MYTHKTIRFTILLAVLLIASLACNFPGVGAPATPEPVVVSSQAAAELQQNVQSAAATAISGGPVSLVITEGQLTSLAALELQNLQEPRIEEVQILLRDGLIKVSGKVNQGGFSAEMKLALSASIGADGLPKTKAESASLGPIPIPDALLDQLTNQIDEMLASQLAQNGQRMVVENLTIADGVMAISGRLQ